MLGLLFDACVYVYACVYMCMCMYISGFHPGEQGFFDPPLRISGRDIPPPPTIFANTKGNLPIRVLLIVGSVTPC